MSRDITIRFASEQAAMHFATWLCEAGEQDYWNWMEYHEQEEEGDITAVSFNYWSNEEADFMDDWTIRTELGRLSSYSEEE